MHRPVRDLAEVFLQVIVTAEPAEVSLLWWLWYVRACQGCQKIISTTNGGQVRRHFSLNPFKQPSTILLLFSIEAISPDILTCGLQTYNLEVSSYNCGGTRISYFTLFRVKWSAVEWKSGSTYLFKRVFS